jgi:hypothetical protein
MTRPADCAAGRLVGHFLLLDGLGAGRRMVSTVVVAGRRCASRTGMNSPVLASRPILWVVVDLVILLFLAPQGVAKPGL